MDENVRKAKEQFVADHGAPQGGPIPMEQVRLPTALLAVSPGTERESRLPRETELNPGRGSRPHGPPPCLPVLFHLLSHRERRFS